MKKIFTYLASAALVLAASCNKMEEVNTPVDTTTPFETETITVQLNPGTKTSLGKEGTATLWSQGDAVDVTTGGTYLGTLDNYLGNVDTFSGKVIAGIDGEKKITLIYPADSDGCVPTEQEAVENSFAERAAVLEGTTTMADLRAGNPVTMKNMTALLKFSVARTGDVIFSLVESNECNNEYTITGCEAGKTYYACVYPFEGVNLSYTVAGKNGAKSKSGVTFEAGKIYDLGTLTEEFVPQDGYIYLEPNSNWNVDNARFAAYFFSDTWASMTLVEGQINIYQCEIPDGEIDIIFCRMNPNTTDNNWGNDNMWNQTSDLKMTDGTLYTVSEGAWSKGDGKWSGNPAVVAPVEPENPGTGEGEEETDNNLYLKPNSNWTQANARFAAYFFNNSTNKNIWVSMT